MTLQAVKGGWVKVRKTSVHHWEFHNGIDPINPGSQWPHILPRGWTCWVYAADDDEFREWMTRMCPTADVCHRFNSGDPMTTVYIKDDKEAILFRLRWV